MWTILVFGVLALVSAARFAWRGDHRLTPFVRWMTCTTAASSLLGFVTGMMAVFNHLLHKVPADERITTLFEGTKEALNCVAFGLMMTSLTCLVVAVGYRRFPAPA
jgi:biopolymer transport protein ExbB/TolQ